MIESANILSDLLPAPDIGLDINYFWGYPSSPTEGYAAINPVGQIIGSIIMFFVLGFLPTWILCWILKSAGVLRIPKEVELAGLDYVEGSNIAAQSNTIVEAELSEARR